MPKMKTHSGAKKRFKVTGSGKLLRTKAGKGHLNEHKSAARIRRISGTEELAKADVKRAKKLLGR